MFKHLKTFEFINNFILPNTLILYKKTIIFLYILTISQIFNIPMYYYRKRYTKTD